MKKNVFVRKLTGILLSVTLLCQIIVPAFADSHDTAGNTPAPELPKAAAQTMPFSDMVSEDSWSYKALTAAVEAGLLKGNNGRLKPFDPITRAEMITIVLRALGLDDSQGRNLNPFKADIDSFRDVHKNDWYFDEIAMAYRLKLLNGISISEMSPCGIVSREQAFAVLCRMMRLQTESADMTMLKKYADADELSDWAKPYAAVMTEKGYVSGSGSRLNPQAAITRQEFAQLFYNLFETNYISGQAAADSISGKTMEEMLL